MGGDRWLCGERRVAPAAFRCRVFTAVEWTALGVSRMELTQHRRSRNHAYRDGSMLVGCLIFLHRPSALRPSRRRGGFAASAGSLPLLFGAGQFAALLDEHLRPAASPFGGKERKKPRRVPARLFIAYCLSYTLTRLRSLPIRSNRTTPSALANRVSSEPMPTFVPGWI